MADTPPETPPPSDEPTPQEEQRISRILAKLLADDDARQPAPATPPSAPPPSAPQGDFRSAINAVLDEREKDSKRSEVIDGLRRDVDELKKGGTKKRYWFSPLF